MSAAPSAEAGIAGRELASWNWQTMANDPMRTDKAPRLDYACGEPRRRPRRRAGLFIAIGVLTEVAALAAVIMTVGGGDGTYTFARILFPYTSAFLGSGITIVPVVLAIGQYPLYGLLLAIGASRGIVVRIALILLTLHFFMIIISFVTATSNYS